MVKIWQRKYLRVSVPLTKSFTVWPILHLVIVLGVKRALACGAQAGFPKARLQWGGIVPSLGAWPVTHSLIHPTLSPLILLLEVTGASSQHQTHYRRTGDKYCLTPLMETTLCGSLLFHMATFPTVSRCLETHLLMRFWRAQEVSAYTQPRSLWRKEASSASLLCRVAC